MKLSFHRTREDEMSEKTGKRENVTLDEAIRYVIAASNGLTYKYPEGWDKNTYDHGQDPAMLTLNLTKEQ